MSDYVLRSGDDRLKASDSRSALRAAHRCPEDEAAAGLLGRLDLSVKDRQAIARRATELVQAVRAERSRFGGLDAFLQEFGLDTAEGVVLMCLAESLLRVPDAGTVDELIRDKLADGDWARHVGKSPSALVNASSWALMLSGRLLREDEPDTGELSRAMRRLLQRSGEPVIRQAMVQAMRIMGRHFVLGETIGAALKEARDDEKRGYRYSYDMLGEAAMTMADADRYLASYADAIAHIGKASKGRGPIDGPGVSVKLSALHPRYEEAQADRVHAELYPRLMQLCEAARAADIGLCVDAEEADRLEISLDLIARAAAEPSLKGWAGFGLAVQAYQKRAIHVIDWLAELSRSTGRRLMVRLVKGAYWDTEIKHAQVEGLSGYPVFTRKRTTDVSWLTCAQTMLAEDDAFYPQFATHNAHSVAAILTMAKARGTAAFEFQRLHGMGEGLYEAVTERGPEDERVPCRIYAPVGGHRELLAYLVRRLLENGANTSFVNRLADEELPIEEVVGDPIRRLKESDPVANPQIVRPPQIFGDERTNSAGTDLAGRDTLRALTDAMAKHDGGWHAAPTIEGVTGDARDVVGPADTTRVIGSVIEATADAVPAAMETATAGYHAWNAATAEHRADCLERAADLYEAETARLMAMCVREGGKTLPDAVAEVREAVDFLRYYAAQARREFGAATVLPGPTGETNTWRLSGRGVFVCISPWNFPLAIFTGQVAAGLAAGNAVIAKPAEQTPLIAAAAVDLLHKAGVPRDALILMPGQGAEVGAALTAHEGIAGVAFTGSTETARAINRTLAARDGPIVPLIAETGGLNCMIVDSTALPEQVTRDVVTSAFRSAGQRCSALRALFVQADVADRMTAMIAGGLEELAVGDPAFLDTDVGPVIDDDAHAMLTAHAGAMQRIAARSWQCARLTADAEGRFFMPRAFEIERLDQIGGEKFGPILHIIRFAGDRLDQVLEQVRATGFGLTFGLHSRIDERAEDIAAALPVGNIYVNRSMIGAVVGVQPFGGEGLSGTGPKAGGPHYLHRFATERVVSVDTTASGGNATLLAMGSEG